MIIAAWPGTGKSFLGTRYENILDAETTYFQYVVDKNLNRVEFEKQKKTARKSNPEWPDNYIDYLLKNYNKYDLILIPLIPDILNYLENNNIDFLIVAPKAYLKPEYEKRYNNRGNSKNYIDIISKEWNIGQKLIRKYRATKIYLDKNEYLMDAINDFNIKLTLKKKIISVKFPGRLEGNSLYPDYTIQKGNLGGGYGFTVSMDNYLTIQNGFSHDTFEIVNDEAKKLVEYYLPIFKEKFYVNNDNFKITLNLDKNFINHHGLSFNINIVCALIYCFRNLYLPNVSNEHLIQYLYTINAEVENNKIIKGEIFTGIAHNCAFNGGICFVGKYGKLLFNYKIPNDYKVVLIDTKYKRKEIPTSEMSKICKDYSLITEKDQKKIIFLMKNKLKNNDMSVIKQKNLFIQCNSMLRAYIESYENYESLLEILNSFDKNEDNIVGITYSYPNIYIITNNIEEIIHEINELNMEYSILELCNEGIQKLSST